MRPDRHEHSGRTGGQESRENAAADATAARRETSGAARAELSPADRRRRHVLTVATTVAGGAFLAAAASPFVASFAPSTRARVAGAPVEADISDVKPGEMKIVVWRGQPVWLLFRTPMMLASLEGHNAQLVDPSSKVDQQPPYCRNGGRSIKPQMFVAVGLCTHLGCSPHLQTVDGKPQPTEFFCPCHGSRFDLAGRVYKDVPAPKNLLIPRYRYLSEARILVGDDKAKS